MLKHSKHNGQLKKKNKEKKQQKEQKKEQLLKSKLKKPRNNKIERRQLQKLQESRL